MSFDGNFAKEIDEPNGQVKVFDLMVRDDVEKEAYKF